MNGRFPAALTAAILVVLNACDTERKKECTQLTSVLTPLDDAAPTSASVGRLRAAIDAQTLADEPLHEYAGTLNRTLGILASTLALKEGASPPDGTDDVVQTNLKQARAARDDVTHYCAE